MNKPEGFCVLFYFILFLLYSTVQIHIFGVKERCVMDIMLYWIYDM